MDFIGKVIGVILAFVMLVGGPLTMAHMSNTSFMRQMLLNETVQFIDKVTDKGTLTSEDMNDLYMGVNAYGGAFDAVVQRGIRIATLKPDGRVVSTYFYDDNVTRIASLGSIKLNTGDTIKVTVKQIGRLTGQNVSWAMLHIDEADFNFSLAGCVR